MPSTVNDTLMMPLGLGLQKGKKNKKREKRKEKKEKRLGDEAIGAGDDSLVLFLPLFLSFP